MMTTDNAEYQHPFHLLDAFALDSLDQDEEQAVADHIDWCETCSSIVNGNLQVASALADSVPEATPPTYLRSRVLDSIGINPASITQDSIPATVSVPRQRVPSSWSKVSRRVGVRWIRYLTPVAAALAIAAVAIITTLNVQLSGEMDGVQSENTQLRRQLDQSMATTTALTQTSATVSQMQGNLQRWQQTSYALAQPGNQTLVMSPARPGIESRGVLVVSEDGSEAVLMASDLEPLQPDTVYHVWLTRGGQWYWAGEMDVDERGWGTMPMNSTESLMQYDSVQISRGMGVAAAKAAPVGTTERARATASMIGEMVLVRTLP